MSEAVEGAQIPESTPARHIVRVEAKPAQMIIDDWYMGADDYSWAEDMGDDPAYHEEMKREEEEFERRVGGPLNYQPFDAKTELRAIRQANHEGAGLTKEERALQMRSLRETLAYQTTGIATTIRDLYTAIQDNPDLTEDELMQIVRAVAPEYRFTKDQLHLFRNGLENYAAKHAMVEKYRGMYPDDKELFEVCFGRSPEGEVKIVKRPMILHFGCGNKDDYVWAYSFYKTDGDPDNLEEADAERALQSKGVALSHVKEPELDGVVTVERASKLEYRYDPKERKQVVDKDIELHIFEQMDDVVISVPGVNTWRIKVVDRDQSGRPARLQFLDTDEPDAQPLFDYRIVDNPNVFPLRLLEDVTQPDAKKMGNDIKYLRKDNESYGYINVDGSFIKVVNDGKADVEVTYATGEFEVVESGDVEFDEDTLIHEEQHQFNKLYAPLEFRDYMVKVMQRAAETSENPEHVKQALMKEMARYYRRNIGIDARARDEILAYYRDGSVPSGIYETLANSPLYNYREQYKERIARLPGEITEDVKREMSTVLYDSNEEGEWFVDALPLEIDPTEVQPHIETVFGKEYKVDLQKWTDAVTELEKKGYTREEVVTFLYQEPVNAWRHFIKRIPAKVLNPSVELSKGRQT